MKGCRTTVIWPPLYLYSTELAPFESFFSLYEASRRRAEARSFIRSAQLRGLTRAVSSPSAPCETAGEIPETSLPKVMGPLTVTCLAFHIEYVVAMLSRVPVVVLRMFIRPGI